MFQKTIIKKYLKTQNPENLKEKWVQFHNHFQNPLVQQNIRNSKEEQYQEGFFRDLFVNIFGYTLNPNDGFNLTTELKNVKDSKKADGAIIINEKVTAVIELKGTNTTDLGKIEDQAFGYKNNQPGCVYVVTSNFEKIRFYIEDTIHFQEFDLFTISQENFNVLYLLLSFQSIENGIPKKIKDESLSEEDAITKKLYKDYSVFKRELFQNLTEKNPEHNQLELFQKTQKLLDRLLFLFFGEDRGLLPPNSVRQILDQWNKLRDLDEYVPLYNRFKKYFGYLNTGFKGKNHDIFAYNGGLFKADDILDHVKIDDNILYKHTLNLSEYDYESEVDVNILGHIFENSLNEIDEIKSQINGEVVDKSKTKRKKDGVFYTPKYITKYIVENTVGKLCEEKKAEFGIVEEDYFTDKKRQQKTKEILLQKLDVYRKWLLQITIVDPACGSGAFLNEALNFLIKEHRYIDEMEAKLTESSIAFTYHSESILENNLFGVDLNEESVEIAKLSLWLRTAEPNRKLNNLNDNIKCGNSLIDDKEIAGDKAFNWEEEFPSIFKEKKAYHLVFTTHNSRTSARMRNLEIVPGKPAELSLRQEIQLAKYFSEIAHQYKLEIISWNVCKDHVHLILACNDSQIYNQVRMLKSISSKLMNRWILEGGMSEDSESENPMGLDPLDYNYKSRHRDALENNHGADFENNHRDASENTQRIDDDHQISKKNFQGPYNPLEHNNHLWSQKFFSVDTESWRWIDEQESGFPYVATHLDNAIRYIEGNRTKHGLVESEELRGVISGFVKSPEEVFRNKFSGGFDVVIGNPPYVSHERVDNKEFLKDNFETFSPFGDLYILFYEKSLRILKEHGVCALITSNSFLKAEYGKNLRILLKNKSTINQIINIENTQIFSDAIVNTVILTFTKEHLKKEKALIVNNEFIEKDFSHFIENNSYQYEQSFFDESSWNLIQPKILEIKNKIKGKHKTLEEYGTKIRLGLATGDNNAFIISDDLREEFLKKNEKNSEIIKPVLRGRDIERYYFTFPNLYLLLTKNGIDVEKKYPDIYEYLDSFGESFKKRGAKGQHWSNLRACSFFEDFKEEKIIWIELADNGRFSLCADELYLLNSAYFLIPSKEFNSRFLISILNSKLIKFFLKLIANTSGVGTLRWINNYVKDFPIPHSSVESQKPFIEKADLMLKLNKDFQELSGKFQRNLQREFSLETLSKKLQNWQDLSYADFLKELAKNKVNLTLSEKSEWEDYFEKEKQKATEIQNQIRQTDREIDKMVYELYGMNEEEILLIEQNS